jgi:hypothetical protein
MDIKSYKINEVNVVVKTVLTKSEAIALCKKGKHKVRKEFLKHHAASLMKIDDIRKVVQDDHIDFPSIDIDISTMTEEINT